MMMMIFSCRSTLCLSAVKAPSWLLGTILNMPLIFFTAFTAALLDCMKQTCQFFRTAIFVQLEQLRRLCRSDSLLQSNFFIYYGLKSFSLLFITDLTIITFFLRNLKI